MRAPHGLSVTLGYDDADRVTSRTLPGGRSVGYGYDAAGQLTRLTPPGRGAHPTASTVTA